MAQPFSSGNPVVDALFSREFAARQAEQAALEAAATRGVQREQIQAQSRLADAQLQSAQQQQQYNNLFRMQDLKSREASEAERNRLFGRQLDIQEKSTRTSTDEERRKAAIIDANAAAVNDAQRANALYKINFEKSLAEAKAKRTGFLGTGLGSTAAVYDDPKTTDYKKVQNETFERVRQQLLAEKGGALNNLIPDPDTFVFKPVQYDETGKAIALPLPTPGTDASDLSVPGFNYDDRGASAAVAGLGTAAPAATTGTASAGGMGDEAQFLFKIGEPLVRKGLSTAADMFGVQAPPAVTQTIRVPIDQASDMELSAVDAAEAERQLRSVPPEQRAATAAAIRDGLLKSGRARILNRLPPMHEVLRNTPFN